MNYDPVVIYSLFLNSVVLSKRTYFATSTCNSQ